ncbi:MAG: hypothetical protein EPO08_16125 [Rhodospirillaceae bacterium]|nr:MAG: hypothetical protein EPO08_16125 [Rhodospirillaceae bacterium]
MPIHLLWDYLHILVFALWLGTDVGALAALDMARNPNRNFEARMALTKLGMSLNTFPRVCLALTLPVGLQLTSALDLYPISDELMAVSWALAIYWLVTIVVMKRKEGTVLATNLGRLRLVSHVTVGLILVVIGLNSLATGAPLEEPWYAVKLLLFGLVFWTEIAVALCLHPFRVPFMEIGQHGTSPEREEAVNRAVNNTLAASVILYVLIAVIAFVGKVKPF